MEIMEELVMTSKAFTDKQITILEGCLLKLQEELFRTSLIPGTDINHMWVIGKDGLHWTTSHLNELFSIVKSQQYSQDDIIYLNNFYRDWYE
jgi:hypothetical protein